MRLIFKRKACAVSLIPSFEPAVLALADGTIFKGFSIGAAGLKSGEVVFNTAMTGYEEILTDPSYCRQLVTLTYPHIGNTGCNDKDMEAPAPFAAGLIINHLPPTSSWRATETLSEYLQRYGVVALAGIDTRALTRHLREHGAIAAAMMAGDVDEQKALAVAQSFPGLKGMDLAKEVSSKTIFEWEEGVWQADESFEKPELNENSPHVVAYDFGVKRNILRLLSHFGARVTVVPAQTPADEVLKLNPDGVFLSNGPGDPAPCTYAIDAIKEFLARKIPLFGICLGHQLLALASGAKTLKMKFGHHGANHPVKDLKTGKVWITSQNHGFAVDLESLPSNLKATHISLFDGSLQGIERTDTPAFSFQGHPEASPGPHDALPFFQHFFALMAENKNPR